MRIAAAFWIFLLGLDLAPSLAAPALVGHWEGTIVLVPAEREVDVIVDFDQTGGETKGQLWYPLAGDGAHQVNALTVQGDHVSFSVQDRAGVVSTFDGDLSPDGAGFKGTLKESGQTLPFTLRKSKASPAREVSTQKLSSDGSNLKEIFNRDQGKTRILLLLDLGSFSAKMALRVVERYVMEQIDDGNLRTYVVWRAPDIQDMAKVANVLQKDAALAIDPRITHFWFSDPSAAALFEPMLAPYQPVANPCLLFSPERTWTDKAPPPDRLRQSPKMGSKTKVTSGQKLNGIELAWDVQTLLGTKKSR